jgi:hypothetical protein
LVAVQAEAADGKATHYHSTWFHICGIHSLAETLLARTKRNGIACLLTNS